ncbi:carboxypeptidase B-like [Chrysoperla carnea]|uniref:carboxypeptidase B-like n=1 Tax=Chrysoperla carnea TaxID=189513 RepID=UPI001D08E5B4|nr:carboxypeptidase B-like [Chrysoperla carnea]
MVIDKKLSVLKIWTVFSMVFKMRVINYTFLVIILQLLVIQIQSKCYDGYKVYQINTTNSDDIHKLMTIVDEVNGTSVWQLGAPSDVLVAPETQQKFVNALHNNSLYYITKIHNLVRKRVSIARSYKATNLDDITFDRYYRSYEINNYLDKLAENYQNLTSVIDIGNTFENRTMKLLRISTGGNNSKPAIFIDGGIHAREWISTAQVLYIIQQLVENYKENFDLIENIDWYLLPLINYDGYEYTFDFDRYWRKTRSGSENASNAFCIGADANRNFDFHFKEDKFTQQRCVETYGGDQAFSEPETQNIRNFAEKIKQNLKLYISFHNYGQSILYPWGYTAKEYPENKEELHELATAVKKHLKKRYSVGSTANLMYIATGESVDWFKGVLGVPLTYTIELPGGGEGGFDVPEEDIKDIVEDMFKGVKHFAEYVSNNYPSESEQGEIGED